MQRLSQIWREETAGFHLRLQVARVVFGIVSSVHRRAGSAAGLSSGWV